MAIDFTRLPVIVRPSPDAAPFWSGIARQSLLLPRCGACRRHFFYPRTMCPNCGSRDIDHETVSGRGEVHAFAIHHIPPPGFDATHVPFVTALIELAEGPRMMALLDVEPTPDAVRCGLVVAIAYTTDIGGSPAFFFRSEPNVAP